MLGHHFSHHFEVDVRIVGHRMRRVGAEQLTDRQPLITDPSHDASVTTLEPSQKSLLVRSATTHRNALACLPCAQPIERYPSRFQNNLDRVATSVVISPCQLVDHVARQSRMLGTAINNPGSRHRPHARHSARHGLDLDLLGQSTNGAGKRQYFRCVQSQLSGHTLRTQKATFRPPPSGHSFRTGPESVSRSGDCQGGG